MNIVQFSLLTVLAYVLMCNGQTLECVGVLVSKVKVLSPLVDAATLTRDAIECQKSTGSIAPLSPGTQRCVRECNAYQNPSVVPCMQGCWNMEPSPLPPACVSLFVDLATIYITYVSSASKILIAIVDGLAYLQCILSIVSVPASTTVVAPPPPPSSSCDTCTSPGVSCCLLLGLAPTCVCGVGSSTDCSAGEIFCPA